MQATTSVHSSQTKPSPIGLPLRDEHAQAQIHTPMGTHLSKPAMAKDLKVEYQSNGDEEDVWMEFGAKNRDRGSVDGRSKRDSGGAALFSDRYILYV